MKLGTGLTVKIATWSKTLNWGPSQGTEIISVKAVILSIGLDLQIIVAKN